MASRFLLVNGSLRGNAGNTAQLLKLAQRYVPPAAVVDELVLAEYAGSVEHLAQRLSAADALLFGTGVYWSSWGSPLQRFLEVMSGYELSECFLGKPAGAVVSMDSVGGTDVAQRLIGVLANLGCLIPPLPMVVVSRLSVQLRDQPGNEDVWQVEDLEILVKNLSACPAGARWSTWPMKQLPRISGNYPAFGPLHAGLQKFCAVLITPQDKESGA